MAGCNGKDGYCVAVEGHFGNQSGSMDRVWTNNTVTFASNLCMICDKEVEKTITLKNGTLLKLCKEHLEEVEDQFAKKVIERHYYPTIQPITQPSYPQPWYPNGPIWTTVNPNAGPQLAQGTTICYLH